MWLLSIIICDCPTIVVQPWPPDYVNQRILELEAYIYCLYHYIYAHHVYRVCNCIKKHCIHNVDILSWFLFMMNTNWGRFYMTEIQCFLLQKYILCIVFYSKCKPYISGYIEQDWTRITLYMYMVVSISMDTF